MIRCRFAPFIFALSLPSSVLAASSVLVWPIFQTIESHEKGSELWLENRGSSPVNLQLRVFAWNQKGSADVYADQRDVVASPPFYHGSAGAAATGEAHARCPYRQWQRAVLPHCYR